MRYLFGDSTPFPLPFDFLRTLEAFMVSGTRVVLLEHRWQALHDEAQTSRKERARALEALGTLHQAVLKSVGGAELTDHAYVEEYKRRLTEHAVGLLHEKHREMKDSNDGEEARVAAERARTNEEIASHVRTFFKVGRLPVLGTWLSMSLVDGRPDARASLAHPGGIAVSFSLGTAKAPAWSGPRKLGDLGVVAELHAAIKKSFFGGKITRELLRLDDWVVGAAELEDSGAVIAARRKPDQKDTLIFRLRRSNGALAGDVEHPGDPNAAHVPSAADPADLPHLDRLWGSLSGMFEQVMEERAAITAVSLDGEDVFERGLGKKLVERLVTVLAPTALEIARRSPNARELSLKREGDGGRREELYLKRDDLLGMLAPLSREGRAVFAPLGLEDWVPATTVRPPQVSEPIRAEELLSIDLEEG